MENSSHFQINDYLKPGRHAHLVGIGGVSMRPLGLVLRSMGMHDFRFGYERLGFDRRTDGKGHCRFDRAPGRKY